MSAWNDGGKQQARRANFKKAVNCKIYDAVDCGISMVISCDVGRILIGIAQDHRFFTSGWSNPRPKQLQVICRQRKSPPSANIRNADDVTCTMC